MPDSFDEHVHLMFDLQALAFASDLTRVFAFKMGRDAIEPRLPGRAASWRRSIPPRTTARRTTGSRTFKRINHYHVSMVPYFLSKLKNTPDGERSLLDNSLIIYGSPMGDSNVHNHKRLPAVRAGPRRRPVAGQQPHQDAGRHADGQRDGWRPPEPGIEKDKFGDSTAVTRSEPGPVETTTAPA